VYMRVFVPVGGGIKEGMYVREKLMVYVREMGCGTCMKGGKRERCVLQMYVGGRRVMASFDTVAVSHSTDVCK
jgi:hypothetical protein